MKILIINQPYGNRGDEAAHRAMMHAFLERLPDAEFVVLTYGYVAKEKYQSTMVHDERIQYVFIPAGKGYAVVYKFIMRHRLPLWLNQHPTQKKINRYFKEADTVVCAPGGIDMGGFMNWHHVYMLMSARQYKKPLAYYGRSFGPFAADTYEQRLFTKYSEDIIRYFSYLSIRDEKTEHIAEMMGVKYVSSIDSAFLENPKEEIPPLVALKQDYMVFVPNQLTWHYAYSQSSKQKEIDAFYLDVMNGVWKQYPKIHIVMLPQLMGEAGGGDYAYMSNLAAKINDERVSVIPETSTSDQQQAIIRGAKFVIGGRYHSVVFAINQERPFIALSYEHKISGLCSKLGLEDRMVSIENIWGNYAEIDIALEKIAMKIENINALSSVSRTKANQIASDALEVFLRWNKNKR